MDFTVVAHLSDSERGASTLVYVRNVADADEAGRTAGAALIMREATSDNEAWSDYILDCVGSRVDFAFKGIHKNLHEHESWEYAPESLDVDATDGILDKWASAVDAARLRVHKRLYGEE